MTDKPEDELSPCPFCGEPEELKIQGNSEWDVYYVICISCGARANEGVSKAIAIENWNRRPEENFDFGAQDKASSFQARVAEIIALGVSGGLDKLGFLEELEAEHSVSFVEFSKELAKKISALYDERTIKGRAVCTKCGTGNDFEIMVGSATRKGIRNDNK
jgi:Lar family restriction alleviation protein